MITNPKLHKDKFFSILAFKFFLFLFIILFSAAGQKHEELTPKSYLPVFLLQLTGFALLVYLIIKFAIPPIKNAIKNKKENTDAFLKSLDEEIITYNEKLAHLNEQVKNIRQIIEERKKAREKEIEKIAIAVEKELEELKNAISYRLKLEEELETLKLKIFLSDFVKKRIYEFVYSNLKDKDLQSIQAKYEQEFLDKFLELKNNSDFINKLRAL